MDIAVPATGYVSSNTLLRSGMMVRFPVDVDIEGEDFRDFRVGQIAEVDTEAGVARIMMHVYDLSGKLGKIVGDDHQVEIDLRHLVRCLVLPDTRFTLLRSPDSSGLVLIACTDAPPKAAYAEYYVLIGGSVRRVSESEMLHVGSTRQDPSPIDQALRYELQNPAWRQPRDLIVKTYSELRSATFGIEDLVGSRVLLLAHQSEVVSRVLSSPECRFMLADEVGLGKTIEASVILKALRRRYPDMQTLIIAPSSLTSQWRNELSQKFWLDFPIARPGERNSLSGPGVIISSEDLESRESYWQGVRERRWGLIIVDEAHHLRKSRQLYERVQQLSAIADRVLILTATPIQRRADEYLDLLRLLDPRRYSQESEHSFRRLLDAQTAVRKAIALVRPQLSSDVFDWEEFSEDIAPLLTDLRDDSSLGELAARLEQQEEDLDGALETAQQIVAYVSANYRIESRMIRNRRAGLRIEMPIRTLDTSYSYMPDDVEGSALEDLFDYAGAYLAEWRTEPIAIEYVRMLLHSAASSPHALLAVLGWREQALRRGIMEASAQQTLLSPAAPRQEQARLQRVTSSAPAANDERIDIERLIRLAEHWRDETDQALASVRRASLAKPTQHRLIECLRALYAAAEMQSDAKAVVFAGWPQTIVAFEPHLKRLLGRSIAARFTADMHEEDLQQAADRFQSSPDCCFLLCDELGGEGRNFQIAQQIIHIDLPWTPAQIEQRIGRVDRLGRSGEVRSVPIFAHGTVEHDLFRLWDEALGLFTRSMSGLEIALETTQNQILDALARSVRQGLADMLRPLQQQAEDLRETVEQERYFEEGAIDQRKRQEFERISESYRDGERIREAVQKWTTVAGVGSYQIDGAQMIYDARRFNLAAMRNARFLPPNMEEAARRSGRQRTTQIVGTFSRDVAVRREDLVFFAPSDDPWTDAVIANALECDRGRCCAVGFTPSAQAHEPFFELLYSLHIDPRPLFAAELDPIYLLHAQSYLPRPHLQLLVAASDGKIIGRSDPRWKITQDSFSKLNFIHLGQRDRGRYGSVPQIEAFREQYPVDLWSDLVLAASAAAERFLDSDLVDYAAELAEEAATEFKRYIAGWDAGLRWQASHGFDSVAERAALECYQRAAEALIVGIRAPLRKLESICFYSPIGYRR